MRSYIPHNFVFITKIKVRVKNVLMKFCSPNQDWSEKKKKFQMTKLNMLVAIKESYERKLAAITAAISKLEDQINIVDVTTEN